MGKRFCSNKCYKRFKREKDGSWIDKIIQRFIMRYLRKHNVMFENGNYVVRMFTKNYYNNVMETYKEFFAKQERKEGEQDG